MTIEARSCLAQYLQTLPPQLFVVPILTHSLYAAMRFILGVQILKTSLEPKVEAEQINQSTEELYALSVFVGEPGARTCGHHQDQMTSPRASRQSQSPYKFFYLAVAVV